MDLRFLADTVLALSSFKHYYLFIYAGRRSLFKLYYLFIHLLIVGVVLQVFFRRASVFSWKRVHTRIPNTGSVFRPTSNRYNSRCANLVSRPYPHFSEHRCLRVRPGADSRSLLF